MSANECVREGEKKILTFQRERAIRPGEEKPIQARQNFQFKSVKALGIAWRDCQANTTAGNFGSSSVVR